MSYKKKITIVTLIKDDPITGVEYGEKDVSIKELIRQRYIDIYFRTKRRNNRLIMNRTIHK